MMFEALLGIIAQHQPNDAGCDGEHARLWRNVLLPLQALGNGVCRQQPRDRGQSQLSQQLLLDTEHRLGMHLPERERVALERLVELLDPPAQVIDVLKLRQRGVSTTERREEEPRIVGANVDADAPHLHRLRASASSGGGRRDVHDVVVATALLNGLGRLKRARLGYADHEVDVALLESLDDFERRVATIEDEHVARPQVRKQLEKLLPLARGARRDRGRDRESADDVVEGRHQHLRAVPTVRHSKALGKLGASLQVMAHAIYREDPAAIQAQRVRVLLAENAADHGEERSEESRLQLASRLAERCGADGLVLREVDARPSGLFPERIERQAVAPSTGVGGHKQQQSHQQLGRERTRAREVFWAAVAVPLPRGLEQMPYEDYQRIVERRRYGKAGFCQPSACQLAELSSLSLKNVIRHVSSHHSITSDSAPPARTGASCHRGSRASRHATARDKVNGIGVGGLLVVSGANFTVRTLTTGFTPILSAGSGDLNQDGVRDILVQTSSSVAAYSGATLQQLWSQNIVVETFAAMAPIGDIDGDGRADVMVSQRSGPGSPTWIETTRTLRGSDGSQILAVQQTPPGAYRLLDIGDVTGDGLPEVARGLGNGVQVLQAVNMTTVVNHVGVGGFGLGAANLVGDARNEILAHNQSGLSVISATTGAILRQFPGVSFDGAFAVVGDIDADGVPDLAVRSSVLSGVDFVSGGFGFPNQRVLANWPDSPAFQGRFLAGIGDVTGDGVGDLLMGNPNASQFAPHLQATASGAYQVLSPRILAAMTYRPAQCSQGPFYPQLGITRPILGATSTVTGRDTPSGAAGFLLMSPRPNEGWNLGVPGCDVWLQYNSQFVLSQPVGPTWNYSFTIPAIPQLAGLPFALQAIYSPTASPVGFDLSNGVWARIGF